MGTCACKVTKKRIQLHRTSPVPGFGTETLLGVPKESVDSPRKRARLNPEWGRQVQADSRKGLDWTP
eukprot:2952366-Rhodomonas_salina.1